MADVIIVYGRGVFPDGTLYPDSKSRVKKAVELFNNGAAPRIMMSGGISHNERSKTVTTEANAMREYAVSLGINEQNIVLEDVSSHTIANAYLSKKRFCEPNNWKDLLIVTSRDHMPRAQYVSMKVCGPDYNLRYAESDRVVGVIKYIQLLIRERIALAFTKHWFSKVNDGDDTAIKAIILRKRPSDTISLY